MNKCSRLRISVLLTRLGIIQELASEEKQTDGSDRVDYSEEMVPFIPRFLSPLLFIAGQGSGAREPALGCRLHLKPWDSSAQ